MSPEWMAEAACRGMPARLFFAPRSRRVPDYREGRKVCEGCDVRLACARFAIDERIEDGLWGGLDEQQRSRVWKKRQRANAARRVS